MNKIKNLLTVIVGGLILASCADFLDEKNPSGVTSGTFYVTESGAESGVKACYAWMRLYYAKEDGYHMTEIGTDIFTGASGNAAPEMAYYNNSFQGSSASCTSIWDAMYYALNTCNEVIDKLPLSPLSEANKKMRLGEVHFLRAFYLWHIVETWGGVVLTTEPTTSPSTEAHRSSVDDFYAQIKADLQFARENLPITTNEYGRIIKPIAEAFSARVYLYSKDYDEALKYASNVIKNYDYQLANNYTELTDIETCNNTKENIMVCNYASFANNNFNSSIIQGPDGKDMTIRDGGNNAHMLFAMTYDKVNDRNGQTPVSRSIEYGRPFNRYMPTLFYLDLFDEKNDSRYDAVIQQVWYCNNKTDLCNVGDTAILFTKDVVPDAVKETKPYVIFDRTYVYGGKDDAITNRNFHLNFQKFMDPTRESVNQMSSGRDCVIIRLAEMYLIAAEAQNFLNQKEQAAESINVIRRRAAFPGKEQNMEIAADDITIDFILDERARELGGEMMRWFDLKRTDKLVERVKLHNPDAASNIQSYHVNRPIPTSMLDAVTNKEEFKQNDGYNN